MLGFTDATVLKDQTFTCEVVFLCLRRNKALLRPQLSTRSIDLLARFHVAVIHDKVVVPMVFSRTLHLLVEMGHDKYGKVLPKGLGSLMPQPVALLLGHFAAVLGRKSLYVVLIFEAVVCIARVKATRCHFTALRKMLRVCVEGADVRITGHLLPLFVLLVLEIVLKTLGLGMTDGGAVGGGDHLENSHMVASFC